MWASSVSERGVWVMKMTGGWLGVALVVVAVSVPGRAREIRPYLTVETARIQALLRSTNGALRIEGAQRAALLRDAVFEADLIPLLSDATPGYGVRPRWRCAYAGHSPAFRL